MLWQAVIIIVCFVGPSMLQGDDVEFLEWPSPYYYMLPGTLVTIPCLAVQLQTDLPQQQTLSANFFRNTTPVNIYHPPPYHYVGVDHSENVVALLIDAAGQDSHTTYHCVAGGAASATTAVYVGDGRPLKPISPPIQIAETLYTVTIAWGVSPVPLHAPLLGYRVIVRSHDHPQSLIETYGNETELTLSGLDPGVNYYVTVNGRSVLGQGILSSEVMVTSMSALTPPAPTMVSTTFNGGILYITWEAVDVDYDIMTPLEDYLISYGVVGSTYSITTTLENISMEYQLFIPEITKNFEVGVASRNSVGHSEFTYVTIATTVKDASRSLSFLELLVLLGTVALILIMLVLLALCILALLCWKLRSVNKQIITRQNFIPHITPSSKFPQECNPVVNVYYNPLNDSANSLYPPAEPRKTHWPGQEQISTSSEMLGVGHSTFK